MKPLDEKRLDETINKINKRCKMKEPEQIEPPTHKSVLLERWAKDTDNMATDTIWLYYDAIRNAFILPNGKVVWLVDAAIKEYAAYLNSAAEVGK